LPRKKARPVRARSGSARPPGSRPRALYLDTGLHDDIGHHANYCRYIVGALRGRAIETAIFAHRSVTAALRDELGAKPHFRIHTYAQGDGDPICGWLKDFDTFARLTFEDLARLPRVAADTLVFMSTVYPAQLAAALRWHAQLPIHRRPVLVIEMSDTRLTIDGDAHAEVRVPNPLFRPIPLLYRQAARSMPALGATRRHFVSFDAATSRAASTLLGQPFKTLPLPYPAVAPLRNRAGARPVVIGILGHQREERGYAILPELAATLLQAHPEIRLLIQTVQAAGPPETALALAELAASDARVRLEPRPAGRALWAELLEAADLVLCPYRPELYAASFSSVAVEALANGIPVVVPARTTMAALLQDCGEAGTLFDQFDVASIADAVRRALESFDRIATAAHEAGRDWPRAHGPERMVDQLLSLVPAMRGRVRPAAPAEPPAGTQPLPAPPPRPERPEWEHVPEGWRAEDTRAEGWNDASVAATQRRRWASYAALVRGKGPLGFHFFSKGEIVPTDQNAHNAFMTFAYALARAARGRERLSVLDWGGGIGYYALLAQNLLPEVAYDYVVKELPGLVALGRELMPWVAFETDADACLSRRYDLVLASSALQYEQDWRAVLGRLAAAANAWVLIARLPSCRRAKSFVAVQRPHEYGYATEYISWVLNRDEVLSCAAQHGLVLEREFLAGAPTVIHEAPEDMQPLGFLFRAPQSGESNAGAPP
jgi:putative methyltransferase (TIGR04325 family)